jgi:uncharacterized membrane protein YfhO
VGYAGLAAMVVYGIALAAGGVYPFGGRSVLLYDMGNQYAVFHSYLHQILAGKASPLFTWRVDLGMNFLPVFGYYLASPFSLLVLLFSDRYIPEAMVLIMLLKIGTGAGCMAVLLRRISDCPKPVAAVFGGTYAVGAWTVAYGFNVMWLDVLYLLPLSLLAVERLLATGRIFRLALVLAASFLVNFYDAALILPFVAAYLPARKVGLDDGIRLRSLLGVVAKAGLALGVGVAISGVLLFPVLMGIIHGRTAILGTDIQPVPIPWTEAAGRMFGGSMDWKSEFSPNFASTAAVLIVASLFPFTRAIPKYERFAFTALAMLLALGSQNIDIYSLWHAAEKPNGFPYRYAFLMPAVLSIMACRAWTSMRGRRATVLVIRSVAVWLAVLVTCSMLQKWLVTPVVVAIAMSSLLVAGGVFALVAWNGSRKPLIGLAVAVVLADATASALVESEHVPYPYRSTWSANPVPDWSAAMRSTAPTGGAFHRTGSVWSDFSNGYKLSHNASLRTGSYELNHFSSMSSGRLHDALTGLGFTHYVSRVWVSDTGSTLVTDAFLNMTDLVSPGPLDRLDIAPRQKWKTAEVSENTAVLPGGFVAANPPPVGVPKDDPFPAQEQLLGASGLFDAPCESVPSVTGGTSVPYKDPKSAVAQIRVVKAERTKPISVTWQCDARGPAQVYAWANTLLWDGAIPGKGYFHVQLNGGPKTDYPTIYDNGIHDFGSVQKGRFTVTLTTSADSFAVPVDFVRSLDASAFNAQVAKVAANGLRDVRVGDTSFDAVSSSANPGTAVIAVPFIYGWTATVDGHETTIRQVNGAFMGIPVAAGEHRIALRFSPPGLRLGSASTVVGLGLLAGVFWWERRRARIRPAAVGAAGAGDGGGDLFTTIPAPSDERVAPVVVSIPAPSPVPDEKQSVDEGAL